MQSLHSPPPFIDRFLVSKQWLNEARAVFFGNTTWKGSDAYGFSNAATLIPSPATDKYLVKAAVSISFKRSLTSIINITIAGLPQLRELHITLSTCLLEDIGLEVWDVTLSEAMVRECSMLAKLSKMHVKQLLKLTVACEVEKTYDGQSDDLQAMCAANFSRVQEVFATMRGEHVQRVRDRDQEAKRRAEEEKRLQGAQARDKVKGQGKKAGWNASDVAYPEESPYGVYAPKPERFRSVRDRVKSSRK